MVSALTSSDLDLAVATVAKKYESYILLNYDCSPEVLGILRREATDAVRDALERKKPVTGAPQCLADEAGATEQEQRISDRSKDKMCKEGTGHSMEDMKKLVDGLPKQSKEEGKQERVLKRIPRPNDWEEIVSKIKPNKDPIWKVFLTATAVEQGESMAEASKAVGYTVVKFKDNFGVRVSLMSEIASSLGISGHGLFVFFELLETILKSREDDYDSSVLREIQAKLNYELGGATQRKVRFAAMSHPKLKKSPGGKTWFPFVGGAGDEGDLFIKRTIRPTLTPQQPQKLFANGITPRLQAVLETDLHLPRGESHFSLDGTSFDSCYYREIIANEERLLRDLEERGNIERILMFTAGPPFSLQ